MNTVNPFRHSVNLLLQRKTLFYLYATSDRCGKRLFRKADTLRSTSAMIIAMGLRPLAYGLQRSVMPILGHQDGHLRGTQSSKQKRSPETDIHHSWSMIPQCFRPKNETLDVMRIHAREYLSKEETGQINELCAKLLTGIHVPAVKEAKPNWTRRSISARSSST